MAMLGGIKGAGRIQEKTGGNSNAFAPLPAGGYVCKIMDVKVESTQSGRQYIKLRFDITEGEYAGYFQKRFNADASSQYGQKWKGIYKIFLPVMDGDAQKYENDVAIYKGKLNTIARSGGIPEPDIERGFDADVFKGCTVGILFRDSEYNGNKFTEPIFLELASNIREGKFEVPSPKIPKAAATASYFPQQNNAGGVFAAAQNAPAPNLSDFEKIVTDGDVPF